MDAWQENPMYDENAAHETDIANMRRHWEQIPEAIACADPESTSRPKKKPCQRCRDSVCGWVIGTLMALIGLFFLTEGSSKVCLNVSGVKNCDNSTNPPITEGSCSSNPSDAAILVPGNPAFEAVPQYMSVIALECLGQAQCILDEVMAGTGISEDCASCYVLLNDCTEEHCFGECLSNPLSPRCFKCTEHFCYELFENCTGVDFPSHLLAGG